MQINNLVMLTGRIGQDIDLKSLQNGQQVTKISVATSDFYMKDNERIDKTEWHNVVAWGKTAENISKYAKKGDKIQILGKLQTRSLEDQQGQKKYTTEIICSEFQLFNSKISENKPVNKQENFDDIPF